MKYSWMLVAFLFMGDAKGQVITVANVKVSIAAESAAKAREQALDCAHDLAFHKLLSENFPEESSPSPSHDKIINMVTNFSIDREKATAKTYTASLTFQFDTLLVQNWLQQQKNALPKEANLPLQPAAKRNDLKLTASYKTLSQWQHIKKVLENYTDIQKLIIQTFSPQNAILKVTGVQDIEKLQQYLLANRLLLSPQGEEWAITTQD